jgi:hypothetical protein
MKPNRSLWKRALVVASASSLLFVGVVGFAHTKAGRPMLKYLTGAGCPLGLDVKASPQELEAHRGAALRRLVGDGLAPSSLRPALDFELGKTTRADVKTWLDARGVRFTADDARGEIVCPQLGDASDVRFTFDPTGTLVQAQAAHRSGSPDDAVRLLDARKAELQAKIGAPTRAYGDATAAYLAPGTIRQAGFEYAFSDYRVTVTATQMGPLGLMVRETYQEFAGLR